MKKIWSLILVLVLCLSLCACGSSKSNNSLSGKYYLSKTTISGYTENVSDGNYSCISVETNGENLAVTMRVSFGNPSTYGVVSGYLQQEVSDNSENIRYKFYVRTMVGELLEDTDYFYIDYQNKENIVLVEGKDIELTFSKDQNKETADLNDTFAENIEGIWYQDLSNVMPSLGCYYGLRLTFEGTNFAAKTIKYHEDEVADKTNRISIKNAPERGSMKDAPEHGFYSRKGTYSVMDGYVVLNCDNGETLVLPYCYENNGFWFSFTAHNGEEILFFK